MDIKMKRTENADGSTDFELYADKKPGMIALWQELQPHGMRYIGYLPQIITADGGKVETQIATGYVHGGGYRPMEDWVFNPTTKAIKYPGDPAYKPIASLKVGDEMVYVYDFAWVCIVQSDGTFAVTRMD